MKVVRKIPFHAFITCTTYFHNHLSCDMISDIVWCPRTLLFLLSAGSSMSVSTSMRPSVYGSFWLLRSCIPVAAPTKIASRVHAIEQDFSHLTQPRIDLLLQASQIQIWKDGDIMLKINFISTLFVDIDISSRFDVVYVIDFYKNRCISSAFSK